MTFGRERELAADMASASLAVQAETVAVGGSVFDRFLRCRCCRHVGDLGGLGNDLIGDLCDLSLGSG